MHNRPVSPSLITSGPGPKLVNTTPFSIADAHNLRAIDAQRNNTRSNKRCGYAVPSTASYSINTASWYPGDEWIGDVARIIRYMYLRYHEQCTALNAATGPATFAFLNDMPDLQLQWNKQDPPSTFEINRNNGIIMNDELCGWGNRRIEGWKDVKIERCKDRKIER